MKYKKSILFILSSLVLIASLTACGGGEAQPAAPAEPAKQEAAAPTDVPAEPTAAPAEPTAVPAEPQAAAPAVESKFPLPDGAKVISSTDAMAIASVSMSIDDTMTFYRNYAKDNGMTEYELLTTIADNVFSMAFRVPNQEEELVVQGTVIAADNLTLSVRYEETDVN